MSTRKKNRKYYTWEDEVNMDVFVPRRLTRKQQIEADKQLAEARKKSQAEMTEETRLSLKLHDLNFQIYNYLNDKKFDPQLTFGYFLKKYIEILNKKQKDFASEITIDETLLSQLINGHRLPPDYVTVRLEIHSKNMIPAIKWYKLAELQKEHFIETDKAFRKKERPFVHRLALSA